MGVGPEVDVILPTFNRAGFIGEAIASVLAQTEPPARVVVVDDGSTDGTASAVAQFGERVTYLRRPNSGKLAALGTALDRLRRDGSGGLVWVMDDDDIAPPGALAALRRPFAENPALVLSYGRMTRFRDGAAESAADEPVAYPPDDGRPFFVRLMEDCFITGHPCVLVRRDALEAMRPFDRHVIASVDYYLHLGVARQGPAAAVDDVVLRQRQHAGARGPEHRRYDEAGRIAKWIEFDAYLFDRLLRDLPLAAYLLPPPAEDVPLDAPARRRALIQRGVIAGRKKLWSQALESLRTAARTGPEMPLVPFELEVLSGLLGSRYGIPELHANPELMGDLRELFKDRPDRTAAMAAVSRPLLHQIKIAARGRNRALAGEALQAWRQIMDARSTAVALREIARRNIARAATPRKEPADG